MRAKDLYQFLEDAVTHSYKLDDLKQQLFAVSQFQGPEVRDQIINSITLPLVSCLSLPVNTVTWHSLTYDCITPISSLCSLATISVSSSMSLIRTFLLTLGPTHIVEDYLTLRPLISYHLQRSLFQRRQLSQIPRIRIFLFCGGRGGVSIQLYRL